MNVKKIALTVGIGLSLLSYHSVVHPLTFTIVNKTKSPLSLDGYVSTTNTRTGNTGLRPWPNTCSSLPCLPTNLQYNQIGISPRGKLEQSRNRLKITLPSKTVEHKHVKYHFDQMIYYVITMHDPETGHRIIANLPTPMDGTFPSIERGAIYTITTEMVATPDGNVKELRVTKSVKAKKKKPQKQWPSGWRTN